MILAPYATSLFDTACAGIATVSAIYVALRDGRWRKKGLAAQLSMRIDAAHYAATHWHETPQADKLRGEVARQAADIARQDLQVATLATKADVEAVRVTVAGHASQLKHTADGVDRIEGLLIKRALAADVR